MSILCDNTKKWEKNPRCLSFFQFCIGWGLNLWIRFPPLVTSYSKIPKLNAQLCPAPVNSAQFCPALLKENEVWQNIGSEMYYSWKTNRHILMCAILFKKEYNILPLKGFLTVLNLILKPVLSQNWIKLKGLHREVNQSSAWHITVSEKSYLFNHAWKSSEKCGFQLGNKSSCACSML